MERRTLKETDQEQIQKGFEMVMRLMDQHREIEPTLWASVMWSVLVHEYNNSGMPYKQFTKTF